MPRAVEGVAESGWRWGTLAAVCLAQLVLMLDVTVVIVALPDIARDLNGTLDSVQLVVDGYALALAALLLNVGALADRVGRRRIFVFGLLTFGGASALCGLAPTVAFLVIARAIQGVGAAMLFSTGLAMLGAAYEGTDRATALGAFGAVFGAAVALGPLVGGAVLEVASWRWIFLVNIPVVAVALLVALRHAPESHEPRPRRLDLGGQVTFTLGISALVVGLIKGADWGWDSPAVVGLFAATVVCLTGFGVVERRAADPMFDLGLLRERSFCGAALAPFATSASLFGMFVYLIIDFQVTDRVDGFHAGLRLLPVTICGFFAAAAAGRLSARLPARAVLVTALSCTAVGLLEMTLMSAERSWTIALPGLVLCGLGFGLANPTVAAVTLAVAPPERSAAAIGMNSTFRQVGVAAGVAALGAVFDSALGDRVRAAAASGGTLSRAQALAAEDAFATGLDRVFVVAAVIAALGAAAAALLVGVSSERA